MKLFHYIFTITKLKLRRSWNGRYTDRQCCFAFTLSSTSEAGRQPYMREVSDYKHSRRAGMALLAHWLTQYNNKTTTTLPQRQLHAGYKHSSNKEQQHGSLWFYFMPLAVIRNSWNHSYIRNLRFTVQQNNNNHTAIAKSNVIILQSGFNISSKRI